MNSTIGRLAQWQGAWLRIKRLQVRSLRRSFFLVLFFSSTTLKAVRTRSHASPFPTSCLIILYYFLLSLLPCLYNLSVLQKWSLPTSLLISPRKWSSTRFRAHDLSQIHEVSADRIVGMEYLSADRDQGWLIALCAPFHLVHTGMPIIIRLSCCRARRPIEQEI